MVDRDDFSRCVHVGLLALALGACVSVGPDYEMPESDLPGSYTAELERGLAAGELELEAWWKGFGDPQLEELVAEAVTGNLDLAAALARIQAARAARGVTGTNLWPTIDASAAFRREQNSLETPQGAFLPRTNELNTLGLDGGWEIDLWGRIRRAIEAADADIGVTVEDARDVLVAVVVETALAYVDLRNFQERAQIARTNIELQGQTLTLTENQFQANLVSQLDVAQARSILESTRSTLPPLEAGARFARNRLAVLLGTTPGTLEDRLGVYGTLPVPPLEIAVGLPADLVRRRPDVRRAERALAAQTARVGVAEGDLYPRLSLNGRLAVEAQSVSDLNQRSAVAFGFGPSLTFNLFDRRRLRDAIRVQDALLEETLRAYETAVLLGLEDIENSMTSFVSQQASRDSLVRAVAEARRAVELSRDQYRQGLVNFQSVLDSQRRLFELEDTLVLTRATITADLIRLYRALGGGWESLPLVLDGGNES